MSVPHFFGLVIMPVVASVILCIYFTYKNHRELLDILMRLNVGNGEVERKENGPEGVGYEAIRISVDKLVRNTFGNRAEITGALNSIHFSAWNTKNVVLCIRYEGSDYRREIQENIGIKDLVRKKLAEYTERKMEIFDSAARETVCILFLENGENMEVIVRNIISRLNVEIFYFFGMEVKIGAGNMVDSIYETADSYRQAKDVIRYRENVGSNVLKFGEKFRYAVRYGH